MADYTPIEDDEILPDAPIPSLLGFRWRDNPIAIAEGADAAPRIHIGALQRLTAGAEIRSRNDAYQSLGGGGGTLDAYRFGFMQVGDIRLSLIQIGFLGTVTVVRTRAAVATTIQTWGSVGSPTARSVDFGVLPGDLLTVTLAASSNADVGFIRLSTNGEDLWPGIPAPLEGNTYA